MKNYQTYKIKDNIINKYLYFKNLEINRMYSSSIKKINKIDHYIWWFQNQKKKKICSYFKR